MLTRVRLPIVVCRPVRVPACSSVGLRYSRMNRASQLAWRKCLASCHCEGSSRRRDPCRTASRCHQEPDCQGPGGCRGTGAGLASGIADEAYTLAGATLSTDRTALLASADILPLVNAPAAEDQRKIKSGCVAIGFFRPLDEPTGLLPAIESGVTLFAVELVPRITRAQAMDALLVDGHGRRL